MMLVVVTGHLENRRRNDLGVQCSYKHTGQKEALPKVETKINEYSERMGKCKITCITISSKNFEKSTIDIT